MSLDLLLGPSPATLSARSCLAPGAAAAVDYWTAVGDALQADARAKTSAELTALAFWLRRARLEKLAQEARKERHGDSVLRLARGTVFHIAPANVETMFAYSLCLAHLCGNRSIVRAPSRRGAVSDAILDALRQAEAQVPVAAGMLTVVTYPRDGAETAELSALCDVRVVWGGDTTVQAIGAVPLPPRALEIRFADRFSAALLDARRLPDGDELTKLCALLLADIVAFDQLACACPRLIVWTGAADDVAQAQMRFWPAMEKAADARRLRSDPARAVDRRVAVCRMAAAGAHGVVDLAQGRLTKICVPDAGLVAALAPLHPGGGLLLEGQAESATAAAAWLPDHGQTVVAVGVPREELTAFAAACGGKVARVVSPGRALDFGPVWDGRDLIAELTRCVAVDA